MPSEVDKIIPRWGSKGLTGTRQKPRYKDEEGARRSAITAGKRAGISLSYYLCPECRGYHLTRNVGGDNPVLDFFKKT